jgi:hypothetical protein
MNRYFFVVRDLHPLLLTGLSGALKFCIYAEHGLAFCTRQAAKIHNTQALLDLRHGQLRYSQFRPKAAAGAKRKI